MRPTEYFRRNVFVACRGDELTLPAAVELAGDDNLVFNTDYPHPDGTWPWGIDRLGRSRSPKRASARSWGQRRARLRSRMNQIAATALASLACRMTGSGCFATGDDRRYAAVRGWIAGTIAAISLGRAWKARRR